MENQTITLQNIIDASPLPEDLTRATVDQFGGLDAFLESYEDVANHGIDGGFGDFIYYTDTNAFYAANQTAIRNYAASLADDLGENVVDMVQNFGCLGKDYSIDEIGQTLWSDEHQIQVANALAWFVAEQLCGNCVDQL